MRALVLVAVLCLAAGTGPLWVAWLRGVRP